VLEDDQLGAAQGASTPWNVAFPFWWKVTESCPGQFGKTYPVRQPAVQQIVAVVRQPQNPDFCFFLHVFDISLSVFDSSVFHRYDQF